MSVESVTEHTFTTANDLPPGIVVGNVTNVIIKAPSHGTTSNVALQADNIVVGYTNRVAAVSEGILSKGSITCNELTLTGNKINSDTTLDIIAPGLTLNGEEISGGSTFTGGTVANNTTFTNNVIISGELTVTGSMNTVSSTVIETKDVLVQLAKNNSAANDVIDQGIYGEYKNSGTKYWGFYRDAVDDGIFKLTNEITVQPTNTVPGGTDATLKLGNLILGNDTVTPTIASNLVGLNQELSTSSNVNFNKVSVSDYLNGATNNMSFKLQRSMGEKRKILPANTWTTIASYSGSAGVLNYFSLTISEMNPANSYICITFDEAETPQFGYKINSGFTPANSIALDMLLTPVFGVDSLTPWMNNTSGCSVYYTNAMSGYIAVNMPFSTGFTIELFTTTINAGDSPCLYFYQADFETMADPITPLRCYGRTFSFSTIVSVAPEFIENSIMDVTSANGVYLKYIKSVVSPGGNTGWSEGKYRMYIGGPGFTTGSSNAYTSSSNDSKSYYNQLSNVIQVWESAGTEDYFGSSYSFYQGKFQTEKFGVLYNQTNSQTGNLSMYRTHGVANEAGRLPGAPPNTRFVYTWTCGDQSLQRESSVNYNNGFVIYYA